MSFRNFASAYRFLALGSSSSRHVSFWSSKIPSVSGFPRYFGTENTTEIEQTQWDVIVSGGGMVGSALACALGHSKILAEKKILLLETSKSTDYIIDPEKYSNRVCALNPSTKSLFETFGAWEKICSLRMKEVKKLQVWESSSDAMIAFQQPEMAKDVAFIVENDVILKSLMECLHTLSSRVHVLNGAKAVKLNLPTQEKDDLVSVILHDGKILKTKLLVGADGLKSLVRTTMGTKYINWSYNQKGIVATLKLSEPTENVVAWQRFLPSGPIALLPLTDDLCSLVWSVSLPVAERLMQMPDEEFVDALNKALWDDGNMNTFAESAVANLRSVLSTLCPGHDTVRQLPPSILSVQEGSRAAFLLGLGHATQYVAPRVALIGDAAHRVHPLAGQGVNLGFGDVECLVSCLETSVYNGTDIGSLGYLLEYETQRQRHVVPSMAAIDALHRLYSTELMPVVVLRSLGVTLLDVLNPIKERIIKHAS